MQHPTPALVVLAALALSCGPPAPDPVAARNWDGFVPALIERVAEERAGELD